MRTKRNFTSKVKTKNQSRKYVNRRTTTTRPIKARQIVFSSNLASYEVYYSSIKNAIIFFGIISLISSFAIFTGLGDSGGVAGYILFISLFIAASFCPIYLFISKDNS